MTTTTSQPRTARATHPVRAFCAALERAHPRIIIIYLLCVMLAIYLITQRDFVGGDSPSTIYLSVSLLEHGSFMLDPYIGTVSYFQWTTRLPHHLAEHGGHYYSRYSPVPALLALPFYAPYVWLVNAPSLLGYIMLSRTVAMLVSMTTTILVFLMLRYLLPQWQAALLTLASAFSTFTWTNATSTLSTQPCAELFLAIAVLIFIQSEHRRTTAQPTAPRWYALAGLAIGLAVATRLNAIFVALILTAFVMQRHPRNWRILVSYGGSAALVAALLALYQTAAFGSPLHTGYQAEAVDGWSTPLWFGLPSILISPTHGLFLYSPIFAFALVGAWLAWRHPAPRPTYTLLTRYLALAILAHLLLMSHWWAWHGGNAFYQRMLIEVHPMLMLLVAYALRQYAHHRLFVRLMVIAVLWGIAMHIMRISFFNPAWGEMFHPEVAWSLEGMEIVTYLRDHSPGGFILGFLKTALSLSVLFGVPTLLFTRLVGRGLFRRTSSAL